MFNKARKEIAETIQTVQKGHYHKVQVRKSKKKKVGIERSEG